MNALSQRAEDVKDQIAAQKKVNEAAKKKCRLFAIAIVILLVLLGFQYVQ